MRLKNVKVNDILLSRVSSGDIDMGTAIDFLTALEQPFNEGVKYALRFYYNRLYIRTKDDASFSCSCNATSTYDVSVSDYNVVCRPISDDLYLYVKTDYFNNDDLLVELYEYNSATDERKLLFMDVMGLDGFQDSHTIIFI